MYTRFLGVRVIHALNTLRLVGSTVERIYEASLPHLDQDIDQREVGEAYRATRHALDKEG